ncbi:MAG: hypothetical protein PHS33_07980 [Candidatus Omnitrophica bacterium]|nr:hypothetical protein [Candidatus Omnitrophota bacterium]
MKKIFFLFFIFISVCSFGQKSIITVPDATTAFGVNVSEGTKVYDADANLYYYCITGTHEDSTLTISWDNFIRQANFTDIDSSLFALNTTKAYLKPGLTAVGIGTSDPAEKLEVSGNIRIASTYSLLYPDTSLARQIKGNFFFGAQNTSLTSGTGNTTMGYLAGTSLTSAVNNTFIGQEAGEATQTGGANTFIGRQAGHENTGSLNTFVGALSGWKNTTGANNSFFGEGSGEFNTTGSNNTYIGLEAGLSATTGDYNTFLGPSAGFSANTDSSVYIGYAAGGNNDGEGTVAIGAWAGYAASSDKCVYIGFDAGKNNTTSNTLFIDNTNTANPLIYGNFSSDSLAVNGKLKATTFQMTTGANNGYVLTSDASGNGTWQSIAGGGYFADGGEAGGADRTLGNTDNYALAILTNNTQRISIEAAGDVGIGTANPTSKLDVNGTATMTGFKLTTSPSNGYILTSDANGTGTWQQIAADSSYFNLSGTEITTKTGLTAIGVAIADPDEALHVGGALKFYGDATPDADEKTGYLEYEKGSPGGLRLTSSGTETLRGNIYLTQRESDAGNEITSFAIDTDGDVRMVESTGSTGSRVTIGTGTNRGKLHVNTQATWTTEPAMVIDNQDISAGEGAGLLIVAGGNSDDEEILALQSVAGDTVFKVSGTGNTTINANLTSDTIFAKHDYDDLYNVPNSLSLSKSIDDHAVSGLTITMTAAVNMAIGDACYIKSDGKMALADADAIATASAIFIVADATIAADATGNFLFQGVIRDDTWNWTVGGLIYLSVTGTTGNTLSQTAPTGTDDVVQILGVALSADMILFTPNLMQIELN